MKMDIKTLALPLLVAVLGAMGGSSSVKVQSSSIGFKDALAACSSGSLAAISLTLGHVRVAEAPGVATDVDDANPAAQTITLTSGSKSATATVNAHANTVLAKHVTLASGKRVACVAPD
jgi:hypothetical protein